MSSSAVGEKRSRDSLVPVDSRSLLDMYHYAFMNGNSFRMYQERIIREVFSNRDLLVLLPTGSGKSLCYQLPAVLSQGVTVVVSPLISLMFDQTFKLVKRYRIPAVFLNSLTSEKNKKAILEDLRSENCSYIKLLYVSPEKFTSDEFGELLRNMNSRKMLARIVVDEAHCVSMWGNDFRPSYSEIAFVRKDKVPNVPINAFTATATQNTRNDITQRLKMKTPLILKSSSNRLNLYYEVLPRPKGYDSVCEYLKRSDVKGSGIVYCYSREETVALSERLNSCGLRFKSTFYHAGMKKKEKYERQVQWLTGKVDIMVATTAFGMGIDKPDVRFVIHYRPPKTLEEFVQQSGRAGRDGLNSICPVFFDPVEDRTKLMQLLNSTINKLPKDFLGKEMYAARSKDLLDKMFLFLETRDRCRRRMLLEYFSETFTGIDPCVNMCDFCRFKTLPPLDYRTKQRRVQEKHSASSSSEEFVIDDDTADVDDGGGLLSVGEAVALQNVVRESRNKTTNWAVEELLFLRDRKDRLGTGLGEDSRLVSVGISSSSGSGGSSSSSSSSASSSSGSGSGKIIAGMKIRTGEPITWFTGTVSYTTEGDKMISLNLTQHFHKPKIAEMSNYFTVDELSEMKILRTNFDKLFSDIPEEIAGDGVEDSWLVSTGECLDSCGCGFMFRESESEYNAYPFRYEVEEKDGAPLMIVKASRNIEPGEEIVIRSYSKKTTMDEMPSSASSPPRELTTEFSLAPPALPSSPPQTEFSLAPPANARPVSVFRDPLPRSSSSPVIVSESMPRPRRIHLRKSPPLVPAASSALLTNPTPVTVKREVPAPAVAVKREVPAPAFVPVKREVSAPVVPVKREDDVEVIFISDDDSF